MEIHRVLGMVYVLETKGIKPVGGSWIIKKDPSAEVDRANSMTPFSIPGRLIPYRW
jgi:hypothetical protein